MAMAREGRRKRGPSENFLTALPPSNTMYLFHFMWFGNLNECLKVVCMTDGRPRGWAESPNEHELYWLLFTFFLGCLFSLCLRHARSLYWCCMHKPKPQEDSGDRGTRGCRGLRFLCSWKYCTDSVLPLRGTLHSVQEERVLILKNFILNSEFRRVEVP